MNQHRFAPFSQPERDVLHDGLMGEVTLDPTEDPTFPAVVAAARALLQELDSTEAGVMALSWRTGRHNARTLYAIVGDEPTREDVMIGSMDPGLGQHVVDAHNRWLASQ